MIILMLIQFPLLAAWTVLCSLLAGLMALIPIPFCIRIAQSIPGKLWAPILLLIFGIRVNVVGKENIERKPSKIYLANHQSHLDILVMFKALPVNLFFIAKKELRKVPFMGWAMEKVGMIFIDRSNREKAMKSMREAGQMIHAGKDVVSFPEGTRSKDGKIAAFKKGSFALAKEAKVSLVPVTISGAQALLPPGKFSVRPGKVTVTIGKPIPPEAFEQLSNDELAVKVRESILSQQR